MLRPSHEDSLIWPPGGVRCFLWLRLGVRLTCGCAVIHSQAISVESLN